MMQKVHIIGGGTSFHIAPHLALSALAYGKVVRDLFNIFVDIRFDGLVHCYTTKMAGNRHTVWTARSGVDDMEAPNLETNDDIAALLDKLCEDKEPKIIYLPAALCDFNVTGLSKAGGWKDIGKDQERLNSDIRYSLDLSPAAKIINRIRKERKDIYLVGFKTTAGETPEKQFEKGLTLLKKASCNLVLANDIRTKMNIIVTPENAPYSPTTDRRHALRELVTMAVSRSKGHFTRSIVAEGKPVSWDSDLVPDTLRTVVDWCIQKGAYKPFLGATVGHFAFKVEDNKFVTSRRKTNFNNMKEVGMVLVETLGDDRVIAYGSRPSVGGQSQRIIFREHPEMDCIVHFHCPLRPDAFGNSTAVPIREQKLHECGSHECGKNTSDGLQAFQMYSPEDYDKGKLVMKVKAVMLDKHGPNIVFHRDVNPNAVIKFIEANWDLSRSTSELQL